MGGVAAGPTRGGAGGPGWRDVSLRWRDAPARESLDGCWAGIPAWIEPPTARRGLDQGSGVAEGCPVGPGCEMSVVGTTAWVVGVLVGVRVGSVVGRKVGSLLGVLVEVVVGLSDRREGSVALVVALVVALGRTTDLPGLSTVGVGLMGRVDAGGGRTRK